MKVSDITQLLFNICVSQSVKQAPRSGNENSVSEYNQSLMELLKKHDYCCRPESCVLALSIKHSA